MKNYLSIFFGLLFLFGCSEQQELNVIDDEHREVIKLTPQVAQKNFAQLLSKAVSNNAEIRRFIKNEALSQFDNDYDVFYPFVKNKIVANGQTFREILLSYCDNEEMLSQIEESSLLLNILVPDLSLFDSFNAENWDINDAEISVISKDDIDNTLYENGEDIGSLPLNEIPAFPCLVVKNNERLREAKGTTRSGEITYEFIDEIYDGKLNPQTRHSSFDENVETTDDSEFYVKASELHPSIIRAWEEFKNVPKAFARDYVYYNINKTNQAGELNRNFRESLYKFRIFPSWLRIISDQEGKDPALVTKFSQKKRYLTNDEIIKNMWTAGKFQIIFDTYIGSEKSSEIMRQRIPFSLSPTQLWSLEKVHIDHKNNTAFRHSKNTYTIDPNNLKPKWVYPEKLGSLNSIFLQPWDLYAYSTMINIFVSEYDDGQTIEESRSVMNQYVHKVDASGEIGGGGDKGAVKWGVKLGYGYSSTTTNTSSTKVTTTVGSDDLGNLIFNYSDPIIVDDSQKNTKGYKVFAVKSGNAVEAILLPKSVY